MSGIEDDQANAGAPEPDGASASRPKRRPITPGGPIGDAARDRIGRGLRLHYAGVLAQPIPDRLRTLLNDLAARSDTEASP